MKKLKTFEEHDNPYLHQPNVDNTTFPPPGTEDDNSYDELKQKLIEEINNTLDTFVYNYPPDVVSSKMLIDALKYCMSAYDADFGK